MNGSALRTLAEAMAVVAHEGQSRKGAGEPYIEHPRRVAASPRLWGWRQQTLAWLHDIIEDSGDHARMTDALEGFFPEDIIEDLLLLSRLPDAFGEKEVYQEWIARIAASGRKDAMLVKLADLEDNLSDIRDVPLNMRGSERRYIRAKATLLAALDPVPEDEQ